jgi:hypothetical protein
MTETDATVEIRIGRGNIFRKMESLVEEVIRLAKAVNLTHSLHKPLKGKKLQYVKRNV